MCAGVPLLSDPYTRLAALGDQAMQLLPYPPAAPPLYADLDAAAAAPLVLTELGRPGNRVGYVEVSNGASIGLDLRHGVMHLACWASDGTLLAIDNLDACGLVGARKCCVLCEDAAAFASAFPHAECAAPLVGCAGATNKFALVHLPPWLLSLSPTARAANAPADLQHHDAYGHASLLQNGRRRLDHGLGFDGGYAERHAGAIVPHTEWQSGEWTVTVRPGV